jgi:uncharacterized protein
LFGATTARFRLIEGNTSSRRRCAIIPACFAILFAASVSLAQDFPQAQGYVNDDAHVLSSESRQKITNLCREVEEKTGAQIAVVTVKTVGDNTVSEYVNRLFEQWGVGQKGKDNGVMLFLALDERKVRIEVGYGLEGALPDITTGRILDRYVIPEFRRRDYNAGMVGGAFALAGVIANEHGVTITGAPAPRLERSRSRRNEGSGFSLLQLLILFLIFGGSRWLWPLLFASTFGGRRSRGGWHGGWGGGFGRGGFGGFGGFGGGGSGGGGAERSF